MDWYYSHDNERRGPVSADELVSLFKKNSLRSDTLVWRDGMAEWAPLSSASAELNLSGVTAAIAGPDDRRCVECNDVFPKDDVIEINGRSVCARCKPLVLQKLREGVHLGGAYGLWRRNKQVMAALEAPFPDRCVKCNADAAGYRLKRRLYWHHPAFYVMIVFPGLLIYAIVATFIRKRADFEIGLCETHRSKRKWAILTAWGLFVLGITAFPVGGALLPNDQFVWAALLGVGLIVAAIIYGVVGARTIYPKKIDKEFASLNGVCPEFLAQLPEWEGR